MSYRRLNFNINKINKLSTYFHDAKQHLPTWKILLQRSMV